MKNKHTTDEMLSISATARRLKRSRNTVHRWITAGLPVHNGKLRWTEVQAFAAAHRQANGELEQFRAKLFADIVGHLARCEALIDQADTIRREEQAHCCDTLTRWWDPVRSALLAAPRHLGHRCNVTDPATAESVLREWVLKELFPLFQTTNTKLKEAENAKERQATAPVTTGGH